MNLAPTCENKHPSLGLCYVLKVNGLKIHLADGGSGSSVVVLVHGGQAWSYTWRHQFEPFAAAGHRIIAPDLPGSGYSDLALDNDYSIEGQSRFLGQLLDTLKIKQAAFIASSAGGPPVLDFAIRHPERVSALILASTCGVPHHKPWLWRVVRLPLIGEALKPFVTRRMVGSSLRGMVYDESQVTDDVVLAYYEPLHRPGAWKAQLRVERLWQPRWVEANLERITAPTLVLWGVADSIHSLKMAREFGQRIRNAQVATLPACGHLPHEEQPARFNSLAAEFLCGIGIPGSDSVSSRSVDSPLRDTSEAQSCA